jgi:subtilisin family serine protease
MNRTFLSRPARRVLLCAAAATLAFSALSAAPAWAADKKVVRTEDDLPRFSYPVAGTASALVTADDATFNAFAAKVGADVDEVLADYDVQDRATLRDLLSTRLALQVLSGTQDKAALETIAQIKALEDKPDAKLTSNMRLEALLKARIATGQASGPAFEKAFAEALTAEVTPLPWAVVGTRIKEIRSSTQIGSESLFLGRVQADIEPSLAKSHTLSDEPARTLLAIRLALKDALPLKAATLAVLGQDIAANNVLKPDIWAARDVTFTAADKLTPVIVGVWDSGVDFDAFPTQTYTDPHPAPQFDAHGLAFDLESYPTHGALMPLTPEQQAAYPSFRAYLKGFSDLQQAIDSPEADALKAHLSSLSAAEVPAFLENLELYANYIHGTHVAGIASRGNPAARLALGRLTFDWHNVPLKPTEELVQRGADSYGVYVKWFRDHGVRVVNMSWGGTPQDYESALEKNGVGKDANERKALARHFFQIDSGALYAALKSAPDILFICAAGNSDANAGFSEDSPASFKLPNLLTVGAVDQAGDETSFTSYGDTVLVDANGYQVDSTVPGGARLELSGTSMASPNTVNLAAKLLALDPRLTPPQVIKLIVDGATPSADGRRHDIDPKQSVALLKAMQTAAR